MFNFLFPFSLVSVLIISSGIDNPSPRLVEPILLVYLVPTKRLVQLSLHGTYRIFPS